MCLLDLLFPFRSQKVKFVFDGQFEFEDEFLEYIYRLSNFNFWHYGFCGCSQNAIQLEEKEKREKELRIKIIEEAEEYKLGFYEKRKLNFESNKVTNREREKVQFSLPFLKPVYFFFPSAVL